MHFIPRFIVQENRLNDWFHIASLYGESWKDHNPSKVERSTIGLYYDGARLISITLNKLSSCYMELQKLFTILYSHFVSNLMSQIIFPSHVTILNFVNFIVCLLFQELEFPNRVSTAQGRKHEPTKNLTFQLRISQVKINLYEFPFNFTNCRSIVPGVLILYVACPNTIFHFIYSLFHFVRTEVFSMTAPTKIYKYCMDSVIILSVISLCISVQHWFLLLVIKFYVLSFS